MGDSLDSWTDGSAEAAIVEFVERVSDEASAECVPAPERIAVFDNDGTLWCEKPLQIHLDFTLRRFAEQADGDPSLRERQPWKAAYDHDLQWLAAAVVKHYRGDDGDLKLLKDAVGAAFESVSVEEYGRQAADFFRAASHPTLHRPYRLCGYPGDGRAAALPRRARLRHVHRVGRRPGLHAPGRGRDIRRPAGARDWQCAGTQLSGAGRRERPPWRTRETNPSRRCGWSCVTTTPSESSNTMTGRRSCCSAQTQSGGL
jgi:hypothetical protein